MKTHLNKGEQRSDRSRQVVGFAVIFVLLRTTNLGMVDADDYEALPESTPFHIVAAAGAAAGVAEHCVMYPVDSVKVCCLQKR